MTEDYPYKDYLEHLKATGRGSAASSYASHLLQFQRWLYKKDMQLEDVTPVIVEQYLATLLSDSAVRGSMAATRGYFRYRSQSLSIKDPNAAQEMQRSNQLGILRPKRKPRKIRKVSLTPEELKGFLEILKKNEVSDLLYAGVVVLFYFGARSGELEKLLAEAKIDFRKREMHLQTEKTHVERYLAWDARLDPYLKTWYTEVRKKGGLKPYGQWMTRQMKRELKVSKVALGDTVVTSRTARRTFETQMRLAGVQDIVVRAVLGHTDHSISDVYTDWTMFQPEIRDVMINKHYMIISGVLK